MPGILILMKLRQEDGKVEASLDCMESYRLTLATECLKKH